MHEAEQAGIAVADDLKAQLAASRTDAAEAKSEVEFAKYEVASLTEEVEELTKALAAAQSSAAAVENDAAARSAEVAQLGAALRVAEERDAASRQKVEQLGDALTAVQTRAAAAEQEAGTLRAKLRTSTATLADMREELRAAAARRVVDTATTDAATVLQTQVNELHKQLTEAKDKVAHLQDAAQRDMDAHAAAQKVARDKVKRLEAELCVAPGRPRRVVVVAFVCHSRRVWFAAVRVLHREDAHHRATADAAKHATEVAALQKRVAHLDNAKLTTEQVAQIMAMKKELEHLKGTQKSADTKLVAENDTLRKELAKAMADLRLLRAPQPSAVAAAPDNAGACKVETAAAAAASAEPPRQPLRQLNGGSMGSSAPLASSAGACAAKPQLSLLSKDAPGDCATQ